MAEQSKIEWTDATWNPITGCSVVSPGCTNCYAMRLAGTRLRNHPSRIGLTTDTKAGPVWTGEVRLNEDWLDQPLRWKRPRRIFVCAHGDLFHEGVTDDDIALIFGNAIAAVHLHGHTFQVLTKRSRRMRNLLTDVGFWDVVNSVATAEVMDRTDPLDRRRNDARATLDDYGPDNPAPGLWLGVSTEDQARADERVPDLLATPAAVRFASHEPALGPVDWTRIVTTRYLSGDRNAIGVGEAADQVAGCINSLNGRYMAAVEPGESLCFTGDCGPRLDWIITGGESGKGARPMNELWARQDRDQCAAAGVPFFMKQMSKKTAIPGDLMVREWPNA